MLNIITGGAMSHKDEMLREKMIEAIKNNKEIYVFVPDQFSFEYDKMLYDILGAKRFNKLNTMGLNRFAEKLRKQYGSDMGQTADDNAKIISMHNALKEFKTTSSSRFYTKNLDKPSFVNQMLDMSNQLSRNDISSEMLESACAKTEGVLADKLRDVGGIFSLYKKQLSKRGLCDGFSVVNEACEILKNNGCFEGCEVFFDRYDTFTADEYKLIEVMLSQCENMSIAVTLSDENNAKSNFSPFESTVKTCADLERIAKSLGVNITRQRSSQYYYNKSTLAHVNANVFCLDNHFTNDNEGVKLVFMQDVYDEVEYVCGEIKRLVRQEKLKYSDIAVISRQLSDYMPIIEGTFERYEIPAFIDAEKNISKSVLAIYITNILDCLKGKSFRTERLLRMIKSPLSPFKDFQVSAIEEYCYAWNVDQDMWTKPFEACDEKLNNLETVNKIRQSIVEPIIEFRKLPDDADAKTLLQGFIKVLDSYSLTQCANNVIKLSENVMSEKSFITEKSTEIELVREFKQIWQIFINSLYSICDNMGNENISVRELCDLILLLLSGKTISNPPQRINTVTVAKAEHSRLSAVKAVFVLGANADKFPSSISSVGLFSEREKKKLSEIGVEISQLAIDSIKNERLVTYLALTQGSDKLYVCCPKTDSDGKNLAPSFVVKDLLKMFGDSVKVDVSSLGVDFYCRTPRSALSKFTECMNDNSTQSQSLKTALESLPETAYKVKSICENAKSVTYKIKQSTAEEIFLKNQNGSKSLSLSPTSINTYNSCPFSYFCKYGLGLKAPERKDMGSANTGNVVHFLLEHILSAEIMGVRVYNPHFTQMTFEEIFEKVKKLADYYKSEKLGGDFGKDARFNLTYSRILDNAVTIILNVQKELRESKFTPRAFEYSIKRKDDDALFKISLDDVTVSVSGQIDRVDTFTDENNSTYLKIVDYKTGKVGHTYNKINHGINMQMIIYLISLLESDNEFNDGNLRAGAMVYTNAGFVKSKTYDDYELEKIKGNPTALEEYVNENLERHGFAENSEEVLSALNEFMNKNFYPSDKKEQLESSALDEIRNVTKEKISKTATAIKNGEISASPLGDEVSFSGRISKPCSYCEYSDICGVKNAKPKRFITKYDEEELLNVINKAYEAEEKEVE